ncbi:YqhG family protein [Jeotgalibacillus marinus]|uniref:YqhG family protein n=1 Tax=Jeotgalibacillus marinus TaxID=86667 RepID=A0ABV3Q0C5_9BACL
MENAIQWELVHRYLELKGVHATKGASQSLLHLTEELDRKFMNRPFYWHYRDATNQVGEPMTVTLIKQNMEPMPGNAIIASTLNPIYRQLVEAAHAEASWYKAYEAPQNFSQNHAPLYPWILIQGVLTMDPPGAASYWKEAAISLTTGRVQTGDDLFESRTLQSNLPDYHFTVAPIIQFERAIETLLLELEQSGEKQYEEDLLRVRNQYETKISLNETMKNTEGLRDLQTHTEMYKVKLRFDQPLGGIVYLQHP